MPNKWGYVAMSKMLVNEEREIKELLQEISERVQTEKSDTKLKIYKRMLTELKIRNNEIDSFKNAISSKIVGKNQKDNLAKIFHKANELLFAGFDYYYASSIVEKIRAKETLLNEKTSIDVLVNEEHLEKLKQTVDCSKDLEFFSYEEDGKDKYSIWYKNTPVSLNLIPFKREESKGITIKYPNEKVYLTKDQTDNFFSSKNGEYNNLEYKTLSKSGIQVKELRR